MASQTYLPAGTRVFVQTANGTQSWHTTQKEITFTTAPTRVRCPRTNRPVLSYIEQGCTVYFPASLTRTRVIADTKDFDPEVARNLRACLLIYDIPERAEFPNPSGYLRRFAIRVNLSCWVIPENSIPYNLLNQMQEAGATWHVVKFDASEGEKLIGMAIAALRQEIADQVRRAERSRDEGATQLNAIPADATDAERERVETRVRRRAESIAERYDELQADLKAACTRFGINEKALNLYEANTAIQAISAGIHEQVRLYAGAAATIRATGNSDAEPLARLIEQDRLDPGIAADYLDDNAGFGAGEALRAAFDPTAAARLTETRQTAEVAESEAATAVIEAPAGEGDGTFSLSDADLPD